MEIDEEKEKVKVDEREFRDREKEIRGQMDLLVDRKAQLEDSLKELEGTLSESKAEVSSEWLMLTHELRIK